MFKKLLFFLLLFPLLTQAQDIPEKPNPPRLVNDFVGGLLSQSQIDALEQKLVAYNDSTSTQIVIAIVKTVQPYDMNEFATKLGIKWGVGQKVKGKNNGIVILWATGDRKVYIATGRGMEGSIPDAYCERIVQQVILPNFKEVKYYEGLDQATDKIINYAKGEFEADPNAGGDDIGFGTIIVIILVIIVILWFIRRSGGGRGGGFVPFVTYSNWGSSSGSWGGGSSGGSGGGGFGGFGGGDFGGGGAGGGY